MSHSAKVSMLPLLRGASMLPQLLHTGLSALGHVQLPWECVKQYHKHQLHQCSNQHLRQQSTNMLSLARGFITSSSSLSKLSDIVKVDLLQPKTADEVEHIWMTHHAASTSHIATAMSKDEHVIIAARAAASPLFVLPLAKRPGSFQTLLLQWQPPNRLLFTTVDEFKQWGPQAPPHMTVQLFDELADSHGLVLLRGDLINPGLMNAAEGRTLLELARAFYRDAASYRMVYAFNHTPQQFDFQQLCRELGVTATPGASPTTHVQS